MNEKKYMTTYWMDLLTYIVIPFVSLVSTIRVVRSLLYSEFSISFFCFLVVEIIYISLYVITFFNAYRKSKMGYICFRILIYATTLYATVDYTLSQVSGYNNILTFIGYLFVCAILWVYPNEVYFKKRKDLFKNENNFWFKSKNKRNIKINDKKEALNDNKVEVEDNIK